MTTPAKPIAYEVTNTRSGKVTRYASGNRASAAMDKADAAFGGL
jgi:hypothetical protein